MYGEVEMVKVPRPRTIAVCPEDDSQELSVDEVLGYLRIALGGG